MLLCMINLIKDLWLMFDNVTLEFGTIINVNVITIIFSIFECCYHWLNKQLTQQRKLKEYGGPWIPQSEGGVGTSLAPYKFLLA